MIKHGAALALETQPWNAHKPFAHGSVVSYGILRFDLWSRWVWTGDSGKVRLSEAESVVFRALGEAAGSFVSETRLHFLVKSYFGKNTHSHANAVPQQISYLRKKLGQIVDEPCIVNERDTGYALFPKQCSTYKF